MKTIRLPVSAVRFAVLSSAVLLSFCGAQSVSLVDQGRAALGNNDVSAAARYFAQALAADRAANATAQIANDLFYLGLTSQHRADAAPDPAPALAEARKYYLQALEARPRFSAALNNLAEVYRAEKNHSAAVDALQRAVALGGSTRGVYAEKLGELQLETGDWREACRQFAVAAGDQPENAALRKRLVDACLKFGPDALIGFMWDLTTHGQVLQMQQLACEQFRGKWSEGQQAELAAIIAVCLSAQTYPPRDFEKQPGSRAIIELQAHPAIAQLVLLFRGETTPEKYPWWHDHVRYSGAPPRGVWPQEGFQQLARSLAARWQVIDPKAKNAEAYYQLAAFLDPRAPDLEALTRLAEIYGTPDRLKDLVEVMRRHENELFAAKGEAIRSHQWDKIYQFHSTLGVIYSKLGVWGDSNTPTSAIFQLEHADQVAQRARDEPPQAAVQTVRTSPQLVNLLAQSYVNGRQPEKAFTLSVRKTEEFLRVGDASAAREVLRATEQRSAPASLPAEDRQKFDRLKASMPLDTRRAGNSNAVTDPVRVAAVASVPANLPVSGTETNVPAVNPTVAARANVAVTPATGANDRVRSAAMSATVPTKTPKAKLEIPPTVQLGTKQVDALTALVNSLLAAHPAVAPGTGKVQQLPSTATDLRVREIFLNEGGGRLVLAQPNGLTEVRFTTQ